MYLSAVLAGNEKEERASKKTVERETGIISPTNILCMYVLFNNARANLTIERNKKKHLCVSRRKKREKRNFTGQIYIDASYTHHIAIYNVLYS